MRTLHLISEVFLLAAWLAMSLLMVGLGLWEALGIRFVANVFCDERLVLIGCALLLLLLLYAVTGMWSRRRVRFFSFETEGGMVSISLDAMREFLRRIGDEFAAVRRLQPRLRAHRGAIDIDLDARIRSGVPVPELCRLIQERVRQKMHDSLGLAGVRNVRVNVIEIMPAEPAEPTNESDTWEGAPRL